ncbi:MAG: permease [Dehalococcoidales bacterium]|nr:permease [Dehalococcoidales bacterium]
MLNNFATAGMYFLQIAAELIALFIGITFLVGLLQEYVPQDKIRAFLTRAPGGVGNIIGAGFGALTPFCSCSTIPLLVGLLNTGVPFGICMSFLLASPLLNPVILGLLLALLGWRITILYAIFTFAAAVISGLVLEKLGFARYIKSVTVTGGNTSDPGAVSIKGSGLWERHKPRVKRAGSFAWTLFKHIAVYLLIGAAIGSAIYGFVPEEWIVKVAGPNNLFAIPVAAVIGIPMYIRAETIIPISAVLLGKGMAVGTVVALIIGGAGMSIPEVSLLAAIFKKKLVAAFIAVILTVAVLAGFLANALTLSGA